MNNINQTSEVMAGEAQEIKKQETLLRFSIVSYKTRLSVIQLLSKIQPPMFSF